MKHLKIVEAGYGKFTGHFGTIEFSDGISVKPVTSVEALRLAALLRVEQVGQEVDETVDMKVTFESVAKPKPAEVVHQPEVDEAMAQKQWTREELEAVADKHGIKGIREIASALGVSGKSIAELIKAILGA